MNIFPGIDHLDVESGIIARYEIHVGNLPNDTKITIPVILGQGKKKGPTLLLTALIHGIEIGGFEVIRKLFETIDFTKVNGRIIAIPVVNGLSLNTSSRFTPLDSTDLNRIFPGSKNGSLSQRIAYHLIEDLAKHADYVIDYHSCNPPSEFFNIVMESGDENTNRISWEMAEAFGAITVTPEEDVAGTFAHHLNSIGIPSITPELTFSRRFNHSSEAGVIGTINVMNYLGMVDTEIKEIENVTPFKALKYTICFANEAGFVYFTKKVGDKIKIDEKFAIIRNMWGDSVEELKSPVDGRIIAYPLAGNQAVFTGDKIAYIAY